MTSFHGLNAAGKSVFATSIAFGLLGTIATAARIAIRSQSWKNLGTDDWLALFAWFMLLAVIIVNNIGAFSIGGVVNEAELTKLPAHVVETYQIVSQRSVTVLTHASSLIIRCRQMLWTAELPFDLGVTACRLSVLWLYHRLFPVRLINRFGSILGIVCIMWAVVSLLVVINYCQPVRKVYEPEIPGHCFGHYPQYYLAKEILGTLIEAAILILPIKVVAGLHMRKGKKFALSCLFLLGSFVVVTEAVRAAVVFDPAHVADITGMIWTNVHIGTAVTCISLPLLRPVFLDAAAITHSGAQKFGFRLRSLIRGGTSPKRSNPQHTGPENWSNFEHLHSQPQSQDRGLANSVYEGREGTAFASAEGEGFGSTDHGMPRLQGNQIGVTKTIEVV